MLTKEKSTSFADEVRIIPRWVFVIAFLAFMAVVVGLVVVSRGDKTAPSAAVMGCLGIIAGSAVAAVILLIGYINRDAGRRGMNPTLWTLIAIFVPNALGVVLYFVLRKPRTSNCPQCSAAVEPGFGFCPRCRCRLTPVCPHCQRSVSAGDKFCPYCGGDLATAANTVSAPVSGQS